MVVGFLTEAMKWVAGGKQNSPSSAASSNRTWFEDGSPAMDRFFSEFSMSPMGKCWKTSAALNLNINKRSSSVSASSQGSELDIGGESGVPLMQVSYEVGSARGSNAADSVAPVMGLSLPS